MFQNLYPDEEYRSSYEIPYESYYQKGFRGILFDVDNTLVEHDQPVTIEAIALFEKLRKIGFEVCIISNNKEPRVKPLADTLGAKYVYKADKPSAKGYVQGMEHYGYHCFQYHVCRRSDIYRHLGSKTCRRICRLSASDRKA